MSDAGIDSPAGDRARLALQRMERALVRAHRARPEVMSETNYAALRYAIGVARMHRIPLGNGEDLVLDPQPIQTLRDWLLNHLHDPLRNPSPDEDKLAIASEAGSVVRARARDARRALLATHEAVLDEPVLDREASRRAFVVVAGGGGGAGYVYGGAFACLDDAGLIPDYMVGNSMGAVLGVIRAQKRHTNLEEHMAFAAGLKNRDLFSAAPQRTEFGVPSLLHLHLRALHQRLSVGDFRRPVRLDELEIPLDLIVAGLKRQPYNRVAPGQNARESRATRLLPLRLQVAARLTRILTFFRSDMVQPIVLGRDALTRSVHAVDAAGFSAAVPSILQYEPSARAGTTREIFAELMSRHELAAIVDGGIADNVPTRAAWQGVAQGRAGTRNGYYLAFDCFLPHLDPKNAWLWPITQTVQMQMRINRVYADTMVRFRKTLSPINLVPGLSGLDLAIQWGYETMESHLPEVKAMLAPVDIDAAGVRP